MTEYRIVDTTKVIQRVADKRMREVLEAGLLNEAGTLKLYCWNGEKALQPLITSPCPNIPGLDKQWDAWLKFYETVE